MVPKELADATWLRFRFHTPNHSQEGSSAKVAIREQLQTTVDEIVPDRLKRFGPWRLFSSDRSELAEPRREISLHSELVEATPYFKSAVRLCSELQSGAAPALEATPEVRDAPRVPSPSERLLVLVLWWIVVPAAVAFAFYPSKSVRMQLTSEPPAEFYYQQSGWNAKQQEAAKNLARAYWDCAIQTIQYEYPSNEDLPPQPPSQFEVDPADSRGIAQDNDPEARDRYWEQLREVWKRPDAWKESQVANSSWASDLLAYGEEILGKYTTSVRKRY